MANLIGSIEVIEKSIIDSCVSTLLAVDLINEHVRVYAEERFPGSDTEDIVISTVPDPNNPNNDDLRITSIMQWGLPRIGEQEYTGDGCTTIVLDYPLTFDCSVVDRWDVSDPLNPWRYDCSAKFVKAVALKARQAFKRHPLTQQNNRTFGYDNVVHNYLQLVDAVTVVDEETKAMLHCLEWSLQVIVSGVTV